MTPYELAFKDKPRLDHLRVFGSIGYAHIDQSKRTKLEQKKNQRTPGYRVYDLESNKGKDTRSVNLDKREGEWHIRFGAN
ncbi:hypothetical protein PR003_g21873 [Phytophthora rubi]|uniref:Uncharacterized protein n=1 Tax=Phytophthora rubi TaxID=129364 RepID=A0A6A3JPI3_9STRA|nr:hypothetical protein PR002_g20556 [Phytophthora rubi]KAE8993483.1 hypothetical protein PR001_g20658 [Phytophthora rubi]KAE9303968.1 hypothetical protein PR003_g21873 [Phytophthora rubi]